MKLLQAIAYSSGNKAKAINDRGKTVIVQQRYRDMDSWWLHVWIMKSKDEVHERDFNISDKLVWLKDIYLVDPDADYWQEI